jgi:hypothetical protein
VTLDTEITRFDDEIPVQVEFLAWKGSKGLRDSLCGIRGAGPQLEPDEPGGVEIESVKSIDGQHEFTLTQDELDRIEEECSKSAYQANNNNYQ